MAIKCQTPFSLNLLSALLLCLAVAALVGRLSLRVRGDAFVIATFAFQVICLSILNNWVRLTGGPVGLAAIPPPHILGARISDHTGFLGLATGLCGVTMLICCRIARSPFGRVLRAIREDEYLAQSRGKNVLSFKLLVFMISSALAGAAGVVYASYVTFIDPTSFSIMESIFILAIVLVGGAGSTAGPILGAAVLVIVPEALRFVGLPEPLAANVRQILYGLLLVLMMLFRPRGLVGDYRLGQVR